MSEPVKFSIERQAIDSALVKFSKQANIQVLAEADTYSNQEVQGVTGTMRMADALEILLRNTGLTYAVVGRSISVIKSNADPETSSSSVSADAQFPIYNSDASKFAAYLEEPQTVEGGTAPLVGGDNKNRNETHRGSISPDEVLVTAQKREERLQDVPVPVTAIVSDELVSNNQLRLQDYSTKTPGLVVVPDSYGQPQVTIRGLTSGAGTNPTVGVTVDDVPYGSSSVIVSGWAAPDIDPTDLSRVEVLRGPQGTLYGANSLGGLLKFVTLDPSVNGRTGLLQAGTDTTHGGGQLGYVVHGSGNLPINDTLAIRASAYVRDDPGFIDDVLTKENDVNRRIASGMLVSGLWRPTSVFSLKLTTLLQHSRGDGAMYSQPDVGDLKQSTVRNSGIVSRTSQVYAATSNVDLGAIKLTAVTGFSILKFSQALDYTSAFGETIDAGVPGTDFNGFGVAGATNISQATTSKFTQEIRISGEIGKGIDWLLGGFYNHEDSSRAFDDIFAADPLSGAIVGDFVHFTYPSTYADRAVFGDLTLHLSNQFDIQIGGRENQNRQMYSELDSGPFVPLYENSASPFIYPATHSQDSSFTYLVTPRFKFSPDLMLYSRLASGYRAGGPNISSGEFEIPLTYKPDKTKNYEFGIKGDLFGHVLSYDASIYYIDWKDIQLTVLNPISFVGYYTNASQARSDGVEFSLASRPISGLTIDAWIAWNNARLVKDLPSTSLVAGSSGDRLPYGPQLSGTLSAEQSVSLTSRLSGFWGGSIAYVGNRIGNFASSFASVPTRQDLPAYVKVDMRTGVRFDSWTCNLFVNNIADKRGVVDGGLDSTVPNAFYYIQPRTIGLLLSKEFY